MSSSARLCQCWLTCAAAQRDEASSKEKICLVSSGGKINVKSVRKRGFTVLEMYESCGVQEEERMPFRIKRRWSLVEVW